MINKALEPYGATVETLPPSGEINGVPWYQHYTFRTQEEHDNWVKWCKDFLLHKITPRVKMWEYKMMWNMFEYKYGLRKEYEKK